MPQPFGDKLRSSLASGQAREGESPISNITVGASLSFRSAVVFWRNRRPSEARLPFLVDARTKSRGFASFPECGQRFYVPFRKLMSFYAPVRWQTNANGGRAGATMISRTRFS